MANLKFLNSIVLLIISCISLIGCAPPEPQLELKLEKQPVELTFLFADYCEEKYDSIYLIYPYDDEDEIYSFALPLLLKYSIKLCFLSKSALS